MPNFNLDRFRAKRANSAILPVFAHPKKPFRLHSEHFAEDIYVAFEKGRGWLLVDADIGEDGSAFFPGLWLGDLHQGIFADGSHFILVVPRPLSGQETERNRTMRRAVELAQRKWVQVAVDDLDKDHIEVRTVNTWPGEPDWPTDTFHELIEIAFEDRMLLPEELKKRSKASRKQHRDVFED